MIALLSSHARGALIALGVLLSFIGYLAYVLSIRRGDADPDLVSWGLWTAIPLLAFATQLTQGVGLTSLITFMAGFGPLLVLIAALRAPRPPWKLHVIDYLCGSIAVAGIVVWIAFDDPVLGLWAFMGAELAAGTPTLFKVFHEPDSESLPTYVMDIITSMIAVVCATALTVATVGFALVDTFVAAAALAFAISRIGERVHGFHRPGGDHAAEHVLDDAPHAHKYLTHFHPVLRPHLPEHRPRYFDHSRRLRDARDASSPDGAMPGDQPKSGPAEPTS